MKFSTLSTCIILLLLIACDTAPTIETYGEHFQKHKDLASLTKVVELMENNVDTSYIKSILGEPIDMGFDYRYLIDSASERNCAYGAVFHINSEGKIDDKWIDEICE